MYVSETHTGGLEPAGNNLFPLILQLMHVHLMLTGGLEPAGTWACRDERFFCMESVIYRPI